MLKQWLYETILAKCDIPPKLLKHSIVSYTNLMQCINNKCERRKLLDCLNMANVAIEHKTMHLLTKKITDQSVCYLY